MVSIIMPAYKASVTIGESIESVLAQTYTDWELIVIAEDEESTVVAKRFTSDRIRVMRNQTRLGVARSRNRGIAESNGEWLAFLDSDDRWDATKLEKQLRLNADISFTASAFIDSQGKSFIYILHVPEKMTYSELLCKNLMSCSSVIVKKSIMQPFPETTKPIHEDYVSWQKIVKKVGYAVGLDEPLLIYRLSQDSKSGSRFKSAQMTYNAYRENDFGVVESLAMTVGYAKWSVEKRRQIYNMRSRDND